jgi:hypothetical protein
MHTWGRPAEVRHELVDKAHREAQKIIQKAHRSISAATALNKQLSSIYESIESRQQGVSFAGRRLRSTPSLQTLSTALVVKEPK